MMEGLGGYVLRGQPGLSSLGGAKNPGAIPGRLLLRLAQQADTNSEAAPAGAGAWCVAEAQALPRRNSRETLLEDGAREADDGFASWTGCQNPGEHSLTLGTPGLYCGRPLAFKAKQSVYYAILNIYFQGMSRAGKTSRQFLWMWLLNVSSITACSLILF